MAKQPNEGMHEVFIIRPINLVFCNKGYFSSLNLEISIKITFSVQLPGYVRKMLSTVIGVDRTRARAMLCQRSMWLQLIW